MFSINNLLFLDEVEENKFLLQSIWFRIQKGAEVANQLFLYFHATVFFLKFFSIYQYLLY